MASVGLNPGVTQEMELISPEGYLESVLHQQTRLHDLCRPQEDRMEQVSHLACRAQRYSHPMVSYVKLRDVLQPHICATDGVHVASFYRIC